MYVSIHSCLHSANRYELAYPHLTPINQSYGALTSDTGSSHSILVYLSARPIPVEVSFHTGAKREEGGDLGPQGGHLCTACVLPTDEAMFKPRASAGRFSDFSKEHRNLNFFKSLFSRYLLKAYMYCRSHNSK